MQPKALTKAEVQPKIKTTIAGTPQKGKNGQHFAGCFETFEGGIANDAEGY
jgi:hypothetical protein